MGWNGRGGRASRGSTMWPSQALPTPPPGGGGPTQPASAGTLQAVALVYGRTPAYTTTEIQDIAQKFGIVIGSADQFDIATAKAANPNLIGLEYINTTNVTEGDSLWAFIQAEPTPNNLIRQAVVANTRQNVDGTTWTLAVGDYVRSYTTGVRYQTDYSDTAKRARLAAYIAGAGNPSWDGFFIDNDDLGGGYAGHLVAAAEDPVNGNDAGEVEGGVTATTNDGYLSSGPVNEGYLNALKQAVDAAVAANKYLTHNVSNFGITQHSGPNYWWTLTTSVVNGVALSQSVATGFTLSRGAFQEFKYTFSQIYPDIATEYDMIREVWEARGSPSGHLNVMWWLSSGGSSGVANNDDRIKLFAMGCHLLHQFGSSWLRYDGLDLNNVPLTGDWFGAMGADLGTPTEIKTAVDARTYRRTYSGGIVLVRFRTAGGDNFTDSANYNLGGSYYQVHADGSTTGPVTSATLRNSEAFIGVSA